MDNIEVIGLGALNIDHLYQVERILEDGEAVVKESGLFPGGSAANTIYGLAKLGVPTGFSGVIGDDAEGRILLQNFQAVGIDTSQIKIKKQATTGSVVCLSDSLGKRSLYVSPGANNLLTMVDLDLQYINQAKMLHVSSFVDKKQFKVLVEIIDKLAPNIKVSFSPGTLYASQGLETLAPILSRTHVFFINEKEMRQLTGQDFIDGAQNCLEHGCEIVVVTLGEGEKSQAGKGTAHRTVTTVAYIKDKGHEHRIEPHTSVAFDTDTTGAGDAFATGFLYGLLKGKTLDECGHLGDITAQFSIRQAGARQGLPTIDELSRRYRQLYSNEL